ncbi:unnamed protein product [Bursaphelenchus xylophilus]|uniref:(pine wood nematode) hypothetical protein n=1 Tax=Bursaphelenchus xylophilus TaxID=6326 RepID=A0A1I7RSD7_BURXY|nr:unnamed protein product [Bursaphelenchus xylophilus]CAG9123025.1 unnamed protein product [Bursaphelenchus xylophilus]
MGIWSRINARTFRRRKSTVSQASQTADRRSDEEDEFCEARAFFSNDVINQTIDETMRELLMEASQMERKEEEEPGTEREETAIEKEEEKESKSEEQVEIEGKVEEVEVRTARETSPIKRRNSRQQLQLPIQAPLPNQRAVRIRSRSRARTVGGLRQLLKLKDDEFGEVKKTTATSKLPPIPPFVLRKPKANEAYSRKTAADPPPASGTSQSLPTEVKAPPPPPLPDFLKSTRSVRNEPKPEKIPQAPPFPCNLLTPIVVKNGPQLPATPLTHVDSSPGVSTPRNSLPPVAPPPPPLPFLNSTCSSSNNAMLRNTLPRQNSFAIPSPTRPTIHVWGSFLNKTSDSTRQTIWEEFEPQTSNEEVFKQVEKTFAEKAKTTRLPNPFKKKPKSEKILGLRIRNTFLLSLAVNNFKCPKSELVRRIDNAEYKAGAIHFWKSLRESFPNADELDQFKQLSTPAGLDDAYEFCFFACKVPNIGQKVQCVHQLSQIQEKIGELGELTKKIEFIIETAKALESNEESLKKMMFSTLTFINFLNKGTANESSPGFQLGSLVKFLQLKGDGKSLAWFVGEENSDLYSKIPMLIEPLKKSESIDLSSIKDEVHENREMVRILRELISVWKETPTYTKCLEHIKAFEHEINDVASSLKAVGEIENMLKTKYCAKQSTLNDIFKQFHDAFQLISKEKH